MYILEDQVDSGFKRKKITHGVGRAEWWWGQRKSWREYSGGGLGQTLYTWMKFSVNKKEQPVIK